MRYDLAVYEIEPINATVEYHRDQVAEAEKLVERQRAVVQDLAKRVWTVYSRHVSSGGDTLALWQQGIR